MKDELHTAIRLRELGRLTESNSMLQNLSVAYPDDAVILYQFAWSCDALGLEEEAMHYYEKAIALGLPTQDLKEAYLGLGSTYRCNGEFSKSKALFIDALKLFDSNAYRVFLAMTLFNLNEHSEAMTLLLNVIAETSKDEHIDHYRKAIVYYSDKLTIL